MRLFSKMLSMFFSLTLLSALGTGAYFAVKFVVVLFTRMDFQVAAVTAIAPVIALVIAMIIAGSIRQAIKQNKSKQFHIQKAATYQLFIDLWGDLLRQGRGLEDQGPAKLREEMLALDRSLVLYGSPGVIKAQAALRASERKSGSQNPDVWSQFAVGLMEIRKDLGSETQGLTAEELQQLLFPNSDEVRASDKVNAYQDIQPRLSLASNA